MIDPIDASDSPPAATPVEVPAARPVDYASPNVAKAPARVPALLDLVLFIVVSVAVSVAVLLISVALHQMKLIPNLLAHPLPMQIALALFTCLLIIAILKYRGQPASSIGLTADKLLLNAGIGVLIWVGITLLIMGATLVMLFFWTDGYKDLASNRQTVSNVVGDITIGQIVALCLVVGFYEEIIFRGFVLTRLQQITRSDNVAVLVSALLFSSLHLYEGPVAVGLIFVLGMVLGFVVLWRKSLAPAIVAHFLFNFGMLLLLYFGIGPDAEMIESLG